MRYTINTNYRARTLVIDISAQKNCLVNLQVCDAAQANTYFTRRSRNFVAGEKNKLYVQMPITGKAILITIFEEGMDAYDKPVSFTIDQIKLTRLVRQLDVVDFTNKYIRAFVPFAERFAFNAGVMPTYEDRCYTNEPQGIMKNFFVGPKFEIKYLDSIIDGGVDQITPARIGILDKIIDVSKEKFLPMTVPMRLCILFHEFSHLFLNKDMRDEVEADLNGLKIYLGLGYPRIEAHETFLHTFYQVQSDVNYDRYQRIVDFIDAFEHVNAA